MNMAGTGEMLLFASHSMSKEQEAQRKELSKLQLQLPQQQQTNAQTRSSE